MKKSNIKVIKHHTSIVSSSWQSHAISACRCVFLWSCMSSLWQHRVLQEPRSWLHWEWKPFCKNSTVTCQSIMPFGGFISLIYNININNVILLMYIDIISKILLLCIYTWWRLKKDYWWIYNYLFIYLSIYRSSSLYIYIVQYT